MGLMQILPGTRVELSVSYGLGLDPFDPHDNILAGTAYLKEMHDRFGSAGFTRMAGDLVRSMRKCPQQIIAVVDGICVGAGAILAMTSDLRLATSEAKTAFLFTRAGLAGPIWEHVESCRASSAKGVRQSFSPQAAS